MKTAYFGWKSFEHFPFPLLFLGLSLCHQIGTNLPSWSEKCHKKETFHKSLALSLTVGIKFPLYISSFYSSNTSLNVLIYYVKIHICLVTWLKRSICCIRLSPKAQICASTFRFCERDKRTTPWFVLRGMALVGPRNTWTSKKCVLCGGGVFGGWGVWVEIWLAGLGPLWTNMMVSMGLEEWTRRWQREENNTGQLS